MITGIHIATHKVQICYQLPLLSNESSSFILNMYASCPSRDESGTEYLLSYQKCTLSFLILKCQEL